MDAGMGGMHTPYLMEGTQTKAAASHFPDGNKV